VFNVQMCSNRKSVHVLWPTHQIIAVRGSLISHCSALLWLLQLKTEVNVSSLRSEARSMILPTFLNYAHLWFHRTALMHTERILPVQEHGFVRYRWIYERIFPALEWIRCVHAPAGKSN